MPSQFKLVILVPKLQLGNAVCEALASRIPKTWSFQNRDTQLELGIKRTSILHNKLYGTLHYPLSSL